MVITVADLVRLRADANAILDAAPNTIGGPVNWGNLSCHRVLAWTDDEGIEGATVEITKASPDAFALQAYVSSELEKRGWPRCETRTEW